jgi:hypothetical protein
MRYRQSALRGAIAGLAVLAGAACGEDDPIGVESDETTLMVDASTEWAYVALGEEASEVQVSDPASSDAWDLAFNATRVMLNGGAAGPGDVVGFCVCQNADATDADVQEMTPESELVGFEAVTAADAPAEESAWQSDALDLAIDGWYAYNPTTHQVSAAPSQVFHIRGAGEDPEYAKLHVTEVANATMASADVSIEYAVQTGAGEAMGAAQTAVLEGTAGPVYFDLASGVVSEADEWDILLDGYDIRVNGGVSGTGGAGAVLAGDDFESMTDASGAPAQVYRGDAFGGVFDAHPWYRYDLDGNHTIFPTYDVFLIDTGSDLYKVQLIGYYDTAGEARHVTFRYARLTDES